MNILRDAGDAVRALLDQDQHVAFDFEGVQGNFAVVGFEAKEDINHPYEISIELASFDDRIDLHALMDTEARLGIYDRLQAPRFLHGVITDISRGVAGNHRTFYEVTLRPSLWRLTQTSDSRIWQDKTVPEIAKEVLGEHGVNNVEWRLAETYQPREYLTCREERALPFLTRILAEEGIFYYFEHAQDSHKLIFTDAPLSTPILEHAPELTYNAMTGGSSHEPHIRAFRLHERLRSSAYELNDYSFKNPRARYNESRSAQEANGIASEYELYDYPARYKDPEKVGKRFAKTRIEAERVDATTGSGETNSTQLSPAYHFTITDHDFPQANGSHFLLRVTHKGTQAAALEEEANADQPTTYSAQFSTMPARLPYRPAVPPKPVADGPEIAIVAGPQGEEIYTDEFGRIKAIMLWNRHGTKDENASCWIRVAHASSGMQYGHATIPRIGAEILISYLGGDIDQPIVTGMAYNPTKQHAYKLPDNKTRSYWKDKTHKGDGYNEIRFESEAGREEVWMHAQKDHNTVIENDETHQIVHDRSKSVGNDQSEAVGHDKSITVGNDHSEAIGNNATIAVGVDRTTSIGQDQHLTVGRDHFTDIGRNQIDNFGKDYIQNVGNIMRNAVYGDHQYEIGGHYKGKVSGDYEMNVGSSITTNTGHHTLKASEKFVISGSGGKIIIDSSGVTIEAPVLNIKAKVNIAGSGGGQVDTLDFTANDSEPLAEECPKEEE